MARLERQLSSAGIELVSENEASAVPQLLVLNADYLFEIRTITALAKHSHAVLRASGENTQSRVAAAIGHGEQLDTLRALVTGSGESATGYEALTTQDLDAYERNLRKSAPPILEPVSDERRGALESQLYGNAYKGITDLVTKWWWPRPARVIVGYCARNGISPNAVTLTGLVLVIAACVLFWNGWYLSGLACGWVMTLLDTVDGKLARVTVQSSRVGHVLDHGMDIIHPPFWYVFWGLSLDAGTAFFGVSVQAACWWVVAGYVGGRIVEGLFHSIADCGMFAWRPFDAWFRLITARRNPCLIILTLPALLGQAEIAFAGVVIWTVLTTVILMIRLIWATALRMRYGRLDSWLKDGEQAARRWPRSYAEFAGTRSAYR